MFSCCTATDHVSRFGSFVPSSVSISMIRRARASATTTTLSFLPLLTASGGAEMSPRAWSLNKQIRDWGKLSGSYILTIWGCVFQTCKLIKGLSASNWLAGKGDLYTAWVKCPERQACTPSHRPVPFNAGRPKCTKTMSNATAGLESCG